MITLNKKSKNNIHNIKDKIRKLMLIKYKLRIPYPLKYKYINVIPLNIFQTWHSKNLPYLMEKNVNYIRKLNPAFNYKLFDDDDCYNFIKQHFPPDVLMAFNKLIPGAYKADLWRYCVLYKLGGIYLDIKYMPVNGFKFINLSEQEHWVLDADNNGIYNALMVCKPGNKILSDAINKIVYHVKTKYYGNSCLDPTGPQLLSRYFNDNEKKMFDLKHTFFENHSNRFIHFKNYIILKSYNGYIEEHNKFQKVQHYSSLWEKRAIYK